MSGILRVHIPKSSCTHSKLMNLSSALRVSSLYDSSQEFASTHNFLWTVACRNSFACRTKLLLCHILQWLTCCSVDFWLLPPGKNIVRSIVCSSVCRVLWCPSGRTVQCKPIKRNWKMTRGGCIVDIQDNAAGVEINEWSKGTDALQNSTHSCPLLRQYLVKRRFVNK